MAPSDRISGMMRYCSPLSMAEGWSRWVWSTAAMTPGSVTTESLKAMGIMLGSVN